MKSSISSNLRPLLRASYVSLIAIAVLWAIPRKAYAQLYVMDGGSVSEYDANSGAAIKKDFITWPNGSDLLGLAFQRSTNTLFVMAVSPNLKTFIKYDTTTGAVRLNFIDPGTDPQLTDPIALAVDEDNTVFVAYNRSDFLYEYDASTGRFLTDFPLSTNSFGLAAYRDTDHGKILFVAQELGRVLTYDAQGLPTNVIHVAGRAAGLAVEGNTLFVADQITGRVGEYDANTGDAINASLITGLSKPVGLAMSDKKLFVTNQGNGTVGKYDATTGAVINANFITGLKSPAGIAVKSAK